ncbi:MAG: methyltransferase [Promethearchaeota archaeon]
MINMKLKTTEEVRNMLQMYVVSTALSTALELGLFWELERKTLGVKEIAQKFQIPVDRCHAWLNLLVGLGLLEEKNRVFILTPVAQETILETYSPESWAYIAQAAQDHYRAGVNLTKHINHPKSVWEAQGIQEPDWFDQLANDNLYADQFTRTLYDVHFPFAEKLAQRLDMTNVEQLIDLGGGSGVVSLALLKRYSNLRAIVIDLENVCEIGRKIADTTPVRDRITYFPADFEKDSLPSGFDMVILCDAGELSEELYQKCRILLNENGRFVIITNIDEQSSWLKYEDQVVPFPRLVVNFLSSIETSKMHIFSVKEVTTGLMKAGFQNASYEIWKEGPVIIQGFK